MYLIKHILYLLFISPVSIALFADESESSGENSTTRIQVAQFDNENRLIRPENIDEWILLGVSVGHGYPDEGQSGFNLNDPGKIQVIQMEPNAYKFFKENKYYVNGTMLSLSFYEPQSDPSPAIDGLVQGDLDTFEIHLINKDHYEDTRAFFLYQSGDEVVSMVPAGNNCVQCHHAEGDFDGTFSQFYPVVREILTKQ